MVTKTPRKRQKRGSSEPLDQTTDYARAVVSGAILAGPHVRAAGQRHLNDLIHGPARGLTWDAKKAQLEIDFFAEILVLNGGDFEGKPFVLAPWQAFIVGSLGGWKRASGGPRFSVAYVETGKGSGKSPLAAGIGIRGLIAGRDRSEIYSAATKRDQAMILFRDAVAMVRQSPELASRCELAGALGREYQITFHQTNSWFKAISNDQGKSGPRPHIGLVDELHEHRDNSAVEMLKAGFKSNPDGLLFIITNSGVGRTGVCWDYHDYTLKVLAGVYQDDARFGYVCANDETDEPLRDESCWGKTNPSLEYGIPLKQYLRDQVTSALGMPSAMNTVKRLNFCTWTESVSSWLGANVWTQARRDAESIDLTGRRCWGGLDLSSTTDVTAFVLVFEPLTAGGEWVLQSHFWLPGDDLSKRDDRDRVPYLAWVDQGLITAHPGRAIRPKRVSQDIVEICSRYQVESIGFDRWGIEALQVALDEEGLSLPLQPFGQGFQSMGPAVKEFERALQNAELTHTGHPVLTSHIANVVMDEDGAGNKKPIKDKSTGRIDGAVAAIMAVGLGLAMRDTDLRSKVVQGFVEL